MAIPFHNGRPDHRAWRTKPVAVEKEGVVMIGKFFGKYASAVSLVAVFVVGGLTAIKVIDSGTGTMILVAIGAHAAVADSAVKPGK